MKLKNFNIILFLIQVYLTTLVLYFWLTYDEKYVWERVDYNYFSSYVEKNNEVKQTFLAEDNRKESEYTILNKRAFVLVDEAFLEITNQSHWVGSTDEESSSYEKKFQDICFVNLSACMKVHFSWEFTYKDKYLYFASMLKIIGFVDANSKLENNISRVLEQIDITQDKWKRRWHSSWDNITINVWEIGSYMEFFEVFTHELGHILDLWALNWNSDVKDATFTEFDKVVFSQDDPSILFYWFSFKSEKTRNNLAKRQDFVSWYGMSDPFEDFAECFNAYINHNAYFKYLAKNNGILKKKYNFIANYFGWKFLNSSNNDLLILNSNISRRPFDTTKIK